MALFRKRAKGGWTDCGLGFTYAFVGQHIGRRACRPSWEWALAGSPHGDGRWSVALFRKRSRDGWIDSGFGFGFGFTHAFDGEHIGWSVYKPRCEWALTGNPHGDGRWAVALFRKRSHGRRIGGALGRALDG